MRIGQYVTDGERLMEVFDIHQDWVYLEDCRTFVIFPMPKETAKGLRIVSPEALPAVS